MADSKEQAIIIPFLDESEEKELRLKLKILDNELKNIKDKSDIILNKKSDLIKKYNAKVERFNQINMMRSQRIGSMHVVFEQEQIGIERDMSQIESEITEQTNLYKKLNLETNKIITVYNKHIKRINIKTYNDYINWEENEEHDLKPYIKKYIKKFKDIYECVEIICKIHYVLYYCSKMNKGFFYFIDLSYFIDNYHNLLQYNKIHISDDFVSACLRVFNDEEHSYYTFNESIFNTIKKNACIKYICKHNINIDDVSLKNMMLVCGKYYAKKWEYDLNTQEELDNIADEFHMVSYGTEGDENSEIDLT